MEFNDFNELFQSHIRELLEDQDTLFITSVDKDILWNKYLDSFPEGTNEIFRKRREHDCSCCKHFIRSFGNVVVIKNNKLISIWDFNTGDKTYQPVIKVLSEYVKSEPIEDIFITKESGFGSEFNYEQMEDGTSHKWNHFRIDLPKRFISVIGETISTIMASYRDIRNVFKRSLEEISQDSIETVLELIIQNSLYKGEEWNKVLTCFLILHKEYNKLPIKEKENYCWDKSIKVGATIGKIKNHSIGVLLSDISQGVDLNKAVKKYESIVAPTNYKRPKTIFTNSMVKKAEKTIIELGLLDSLERQYATINDITINNILFANRDTTKKLTGNIFDDLQQEASTINQKKFDKVEEVTIKNFVENILPAATNLEILFKDQHNSNLVSLIAPKISKSKTMFKWNNNFSWAYSGNITDSIKVHVKNAGGRVDGVLRFSIKWNDNGSNPNDFDAHCIEPNKNEIYFGNKRRIHSSSGMLDVDIVSPGKEIAVENIIYTDKSKMPKGIYSFFVHNYNHRGGKDGFSAEIEYDGQINSFEYSKELRHDEKVKVADVNFDGKKEFKIIKSMPSSLSSKIIWNLNTNQFHPVSVCMFSPNYWDKQMGIGNRHYFFILKDCKNDTQPNGFFNEFLHENLMSHKRVFEALGSKMAVKQSDEQLSGLGFSSTKRNSVICKVEGKFSRIIKIIF